MKLILALFIERRCPFFMVIRFISLLLSSAYRVPVAMYLELLSTGLRTMLLVTKRYNHLETRWLLKCFL